MREKLIGLINALVWLHGSVSAEMIADHLISCGVTIGEETNVPTKWIPVTERLPKKNELVLCRWIKVGSGSFYGFARYQRDDVWYVSNEGMPEVTHWMPLPEPPKGD